MSKISKLLAGSLLAGAAFCAPALAAPVSYVKICDANGAGYFFIPGTDVCQNANQIQTNTDLINSRSSLAFQGVAISSAMVAPFMPSNANFAISGHVATFEGKQAVGLAGLMRVNSSNFFLSGGFGSSVQSGRSAGRAGFIYAW